MRLVWFRSNSTNSSYSCAKAAKAAISTTRERGCRSQTLMQNATPVYNNALFTTYTTHYTTVAATSINLKASTLTRAAVLLRRLRPRLRPRLRTISTADAATMTTTTTTAAAIAAATPLLCSLPVHWYDNCSSYYNQSTGIA